MKKLPQPHYHIHLRYSKVSGIQVTVKADKKCCLGPWKKETTSLYLVKIQLLKLLWFGEVFFSHIGKHVDEVIVYL